MSQQHIISKPETATAISFKTEYIDDQGQVHGPARWESPEGTVANLVDSDILDALTTIDLDGNVVPMPEFQPAWLPLGQVNKVAKHFGVEVYES